MRAARVLGDVAADRAHLLARRVGRVEVAVRRDRARDVEVRDARLDDDALALEVDLEDPVHPRERDDDPVGDRQRAAREPGARAARDERDALPRAEPDDRLDVLGRAREHDGGGLRAPAGEPVAVVVASCSGSVITCASPERGPQLVDEAGGERHGPILLAAVGPESAASIIDDRFLR